MTSRLGGSALTGRLGGSALTGRLGGSALTGRLAVAALVLVACTGRMPEPVESGLAFDANDEKRAAELAPDLHARAQRAGEDARQAGGAEARADHDRRSRLLMAAAIAEADRIELDRERAGLEAEQVKLEQERIALERARAETVHAVRLREAARVARSEAARVFEQAEQDEGRRRDRRERMIAQAQAAGFYLRRAELTVAAAAALGADERTLDAARRVIDGVAGPGRASGAARAAAAERALAVAQRALGGARAAAGAPTPTEVVALREAGVERGLPVELLERGVVVSLEGAFVAGQSRLSSTGGRRVAHIAALLRSHPHGPAQLEVLARDGETVARRRLGERRGAVLRKLLEEHATRLRLVAAGDLARPLLLLPAYGSVPTAVE